MSSARTTEPCAACAGGGLAFRFRVETWNVFACPACGTLHVRPLPDRATLHGYYDAQYALVGHVDRMGAVEKARAYPGTARVLGLLERFAPGARTVAEVGCSSGYLLWGLRERGYEVEGFEPSAQTSERARAELGLPVETAELPPAERRGAYDVIVMRHVIEHVLDPLAAIGRLFDCVKPGGVVVLATPNAASLAALWCGEDWEWMSPPAHLHLFTPAGLRALLGRAGLSVESWDTVRGDARPLPVGLLRRAASRLGVRKALATRWGTLHDDGGGGAAAARGRGLRSIVLAGAEAADRVVRPLAAGQAGEELWMIGRR